MNYHKGKDGSLKPIKIDFYQWIRSIFDKPLYERTGEYPWENKPLPETPKIREQPKESIIQKQVPLKSDYSLSELNYLMERYPTYIGPTESELEQISRSQNRSPRRKSRSRSQNRSPRRKSRSRSQNRSPRKKSRSRSRNKLPRKRSHTP